MVWVNLITSSCFWLFFAFVVEEFVAIERSQLRLKQKSVHTCSKMAKNGFCSSTDTSGQSWGIYCQSMFALKQSAPQVRMELKAFLIIFGVGMRSFSSFNFWLILPH
jgi:hypothetical protein